MSAAGAPGQEGDEALAGADTRSDAETEADTGAGVDLAAGRAPAAGAGAPERLAAGGGAPERAGAQSWRAFWAQTAAEVSMTLRRGESLLLTVGIPVVLLGFFVLIGYPDVAVTGGVKTVDFLAPGVIALAVMSTGMVSLAIATAFERQYGVLKRLATTPLGRPALLGAKAAAILVVEALQLVVLWIAGVALGWQPRGDVSVVAVLVVLATAGFAGVGLLMAGTLRAEMTLATANGLYLLLLLTSGMVVPLAKLPGEVQGIARALPAANLADAMHATLGAGNAVPGRAWLVLAAWAVLAPAAAAATFRWE